MSWPFKDYDYHGDKYVTIQDPNAPCGELMFYERTDIVRFGDTPTPTECVLCIEAENEMYTKYAHPKAHTEAHVEAGILAEQLAIKEKDTKEYIEYYIFYYGKEYRRLYNIYYKKYKEEYSKIVLEKSYKKDEKLCNHHIESIYYHHELNGDEWRP